MTKDLRPDGLRRRGLARGLLAPLAPPLAAPLAALALAGALPPAARAQGTGENGTGEKSGGEKGGGESTFDRVRRTRVLRIAALPGELPYFQKDLATGAWSGAYIVMAADIAKVFDATLA